MQIINVVGARPNFMKMAPLIRAINKYNQKQGTILKQVLVHTGQHYDYEMSQVFFDDLGISKPDIYLGVGSGTHAEQTGKVMIEFERVLLAQKPDIVVVVGDVNSTLASTLAAIKLNIPVAHVEAGLRSFDRTMPEEVNRIVTDALSTYLFTPSPDADENLRKEGISGDRIFLVGNVMIDNLIFNKEKAMKSNILQELGLIVSRQSDDLSAEKNPQLVDYAVLTLHRPSNVDNRETLLNILEALKIISQEIPVFFPIHPRTEKQVKRFKLEGYLNFFESKFASFGVHRIAPLGYLDFLCLMMNSKFVMTDSGGIQEETTALNIPCLTLRNATERTITISQGSNTLVGNNTKVIIAEAYKILKGKGKRGNVPKFWDGKVAERIVKILSTRG
jgi:UDP-N-acetylglucosamine 2-epimerase (non-hydrolysing)